VENPHRSANPSAAKIALCARLPSAFAPPGLWPPDDDAPEAQQGRYRAATRLRVLIVPAASPRAAGKPAKVRQGRDRASGTTCAQIEAHSQRQGQWKVWTPGKEGRHDQRQRMTTGTPEKPQERRKGLGLGVTTCHSKKRLTGPYMKPFF